MSKRRPFEYCGFGMCSILAAAQRTRITLSTPCVMEVGIIQAARLPTEAIYEYRAPPAALNMPRVAVVRTDIPASQGFSISLQFHSHFQLNCNTTKPPLK